MQHYVKSAIELIQEYEPMALKMDERGYCVCSSFGKDSMALIEVFRMSGVKFFIQHNVTGIDPPPLVYFGREQIKRYKEEYNINTIVVRPRISMMRLIEKNGMPPTRFTRYCCAELKERKVPETKGCFFSFGVRKDESVARSKRGALEVLASNIKNRVVADLDMNEHEQLMLFNDNNEKRRQFENCTIKGVRAINPIIHWSDEELWGFIKEFNTPYCDLYDQGYTRLGCIGCPMSNKGREKVFEKFPKFKDYYIKAFDLMLKKREKDGKETEWKTAEEVFDRWMQE